MTSEHYFASKIIIMLADEGSRAAMELSIF